MNEDYIPARVFFIRLAVAQVTLDMIKHVALWHDMQRVWTPRIVN